MIGSKVDKIDCTNLIDNKIKEKWIVICQKKLNQRDLVTINNNFNCCHFNSLAQSEFSFGSLISSI